MHAHSTVERPGCQLHKDVYGQITVNTAPQMASRSQGQFLCGVVEGELAS